MLTATHKPDRIINKCQELFDSLNTEQAFLFYEFCIELEQYTWKSHEREFIDIVTNQQCQFEFSGDYDDPPF